MDIYVDKLYSSDRKDEPCSIGIPLKKGEIQNLDNVVVIQNNKSIPLQKKVTSRYDDGSVRFMFLRFLADLDANKKTVLKCIPDLTQDEKYPQKECDNIMTNESLITDNDGITVDNGKLSFKVNNKSDSLFEWLKVDNKLYKKNQFIGPLLQDGKGNIYSIEIGTWSVVEKGAVCTILKAEGKNVGSDNASNVEFEIRLTIYANKPWVEVSYRIINTTYAPLHIAELKFSVRLNEEDKRIAKDIDSNNVLNVNGISALEEIEKELVNTQSRACVAASNYKTDFSIGVDGERVFKSVDAQDLVQESNEHFAEVFYGTFFADTTDNSGGVCATIYQAQQNYPKAVAADKNGIEVMLVPKDIGKVVMQTGMSREQKFLLHFHDKDTTLAQIDDRSLIYQMPDRPYVDSQVHEASGVYIDMFPRNLDVEVEQALIAKADGHARAYGMLNFGDCPDMNYTTQGRGGGEIVWSNNEYDFPHACVLQYVRTGIRRFLDYNIAACSHWMDVDVCHFSDDKLYLGGQWEHTNGHCKSNIRSRESLMVCSHQWVEGLLDYYHFTGDERGMETALGIGENVMALLDTPEYKKVGGLSARETGWALRTLVALYVETSDKRWLTKTEQIIEDFKVWEQKYGVWMAPYTDNTVIRVGFMISVAIGSIMRYYRVFPSNELKDMMIRAVDDLIENCYMERTGLFYYKELPSLNRLGNNTLLLESLAIAYELTKDAKYLRYGEQTFKKAVSDNAGSSLGKKTIYGDAVVAGSGSTKNFGQSFIPLVMYYKAITDM